MPAGDGPQLNETKGLQRSTTDQDTQLVGTQLASIGEKKKKNHIQDCNRKLPSIQPPLGPANVQVTGVVQISRGSSLNIITSVTQISDPSPHSLLKVLLHTGGGWGPAPAVRVACGQIMYQNLLHCVFCN